MSFQHSSPVTPPHLTYSHFRGVLVQSDVHMKLHGRIIQDILDR